MTFKKRRGGFPYEPMIDSNPYPSHYPTDESPIGPILRAEQAHLAEGERFIRGLPDQILAFAWFAIWSNQSFQAVKDLLIDLGASLEEAQGGSAWLFAIRRELKDIYIVQGRPRRLADLSLDEWIVLAHDLNWAGQGEAAMATRGFVLACLIMRTEGVPVN